MSSIIKLTKINREDLHHSFKKFIFRELFFNRDRKLKNNLMESLIEFVKLHGKKLTKKESKSIIESYNLPKDMYIEYIKRNCSKRHSIMKKNYQTIINKYFDKQEFIKKNRSKVFCLQYGINNLKNFRMLKNKNFEDFYSTHLTQSFLKETFYELWSKEFNILDLACKNRFRAENDIGVTLCRYFQLLSGDFIPSKKLGRYFEVSTNNKEIISSIKKQKYKIICINDAQLNINFDKAQNEINHALESVLNKKSTFEI